MDQSTLIDGAIKGMIGSLDDPFSEYLTADQYRQNLQGISGQFEGIGADIATSDAIVFTDTGELYAPHAAVMALRFQSLA